ncbi:MAG: PEP/pyruvate-binding domain-containing protein [Chloroflexota bacterium]
MMTYTLPFSQLNKTSIPAAGGKGANLGEMATVGLPIPTGFVLTTAAYDTFVQTNSLQEQILTLANMVSASDPQSSEAAAAQIRALFLAAEMPDEIGMKLLMAWQALGAEAVAVRSSATAEDLPTASFAGQQDSFLNIRDRDGLLNAVKKCWASLWTARAMAYRQRQGIDPASVSLAVVVQTLVPADASGVVFTANPVNGDREQILINATWGLGEAIVGGLVTPDSIVVDKTSWEIVSRETTSKMVMTVRTEHGTEEVAVPTEKQDVAVLDEKTAVSLAKLSTQIEAHYNRPMDIEWAIADGEIAILQARPITSLPPAPLKNVTWEPATPNTIWMRRQIVEHMPEPLSPLFEDLYLEQGLGQSMDYLLDMMGRIGGVDFDMNKFVPHGFAATINGYAYTTGSFDMNAELIWATLRIYARMTQLFRQPELDWEGAVLPNYQAIIARWEALDRDAASDEQLLAGIREMSAADPTYWFSSAPNLGLSRMFDPVFDWLLKSVLFRSALPKAGLGSSAFLRGFDSKALDAQADMEALANRIRESDGLRECVLNSSASRLLTALADQPDEQPVLDGIQAYLDAYGHQIYNLDYVAPTQNEDPLPMLLSLKALVKSPPAEDVRTRQRKMAAERDALVEQTAHALNPVSRRLFRLVWEWTKHYAPYREHVMFYMGLAWPTLRKLAHELGQRLSKAGAVAQADDIYYLTSREIETAIQARANSQPTPDFVQVVQERRDLRESQKQLTPLPKVPERSSLKFGPLDLSMFDPTPKEAGNEGPILNGFAVSTGRATAPASVIHSIEDFEKMQPDTILVCTTTTPAWTPLFSQAVGLVTDVGGALAHGSIVAREYGIPAVMGTGIATERIQSGMMLAIDGDKGTVTLVDEVDETTVLPQAERQETAVSHKTAILATIAALAAAFIWWKRRR